MHWSNFQFHLTYILVFMLSSLQILYFLLCFTPIYFPWIVECILRRSFHINLYLPLYKYLFEEINDSWHNSNVGILIFHQCNVRNLLKMKHCLATFMTQCLTTSWRKLINLHFHIIYFCYPFSFPWHFE
jgi:hypothetical protein